MGLAFVPLYIKYLGVEAYGLIGFYAVLQAWLTLLDLGITQTLNREMARFTAGAHTPQSIHDLLRSLEFIAIALALVMCLCIWGASSYIAAHWLNARNLSINEITSAITLMGFVIALRFIEGIYKGALLGLQKQVVANMISILIATMRYGGVVLVLALYAASIQTFFVWQVISSMLSVLAFVCMVYSTLPKPNQLPKFSKQAIAAVWKFASGMLGITFLAILLTQIDKVLLSKLISLESYGYYTLAATVAGSLALITAPATQAMYPRMVEYVAQNKQQKLIRLFHQGAQFISVLITPAAIMLAFFAEDIIYLWSGDIHLAKQTAPILLPLVLGSFFNCLVWMPYQLQLAHGWTSFAVKVNAVAVCVLVPAIFWVAPQYGAIGAAWIWALLNIGYASIGMHYMFKKLLSGEKWFWYWQDITKQLIPVILIMATAKLIMPNLSHNRIIQIISYIVIFSVGTFAASWYSTNIKPLLIVIFNKLSYKKS